MTKYEPGDVSPDGDWVWTGNGWTAIPGRSQGPPPALPRPSTINPGTDLPGLGPGIDLGRSRRRSVSASALKGCLPLALLGLAAALLLARCSERKDTLPSQVVAMKATGQQDLQVKVRVTNTTRKPQRPSCQVSAVSTASRYAGQATISFTRDLAPGEGGVVDGTVPISNDGARYISGDEIRTECSVATPWFTIPQVPLERLVQGSPPP